MCISSSMIVICIRPLPVSARAVIKYATALFVACQLDRVSGVGGAGWDSRPTRSICSMPSSVHIRDFAARAQPRLVQYRARPPAVLPGVQQGLGRRRCSLDWTFSRCGGSIRAYAQTRPPGVHAIQKAVWFTLPAALSHGTPSGCSASPQPLPCLR